MLKPFIVLLLHGKVNGFPIEKIIEKPQFRVSDTSIRVNDNFFYMKEKRDF